MHLGATSTLFAHLPLRDAARRISQAGLTAIEVGAVGYNPKTHCDPQQLLADDRALAEFRETLAEFGLSISAYNANGEPLHPDPAIAGAFDRDFRATCALAERTGVDRVIVLAGLPEGAPGERLPNWVSYPYPVRNLDILAWQWEERLLPYWREHAKVASDHGIRLCFEMHPADLVFHPEALLQLRDALGPVIGCNFDPSHLFWQGMDVLAVIQTLREAIYHVHAKDCGLNETNVRLNGVIDPKTWRDVRRRAWLFRTVGYGHDEEFWRNFVSTLRLVGYDDVLSIEHEDPLIDPDEGFDRAVSFLDGLLIRKSAERLWYESGREMDLG